MQNILLSTMQINHSDIVLMQVSDEIMTCSCVLLFNCETNSVSLGFLKETFVRVVFLWFQFKKKTHKITEAHVSLTQRVN